MTEYAKLVISVDSTQVTSADKGLKTLSSSAGTAEKTTNQLTSAFKKLAGPIATYLSVREVARAAESYTNLTNRLRLVTGSSEELARAQADLFRIAQNSRQPLSETAELYQRIATNQEQLGLTSAGVARITETINKSLAVSGTSAASAAGALTQLGQAFASGQLRGEELNSVLENAPALAGALAEGLGVTVGQLRDLGKEGKLTAQNVVDALLDQSNAIDSAFGTIAPTVSSAFTTVGNSFTQLIGKMDETSDTSAGAAEQIIKLAEVLADPKTVEAAQAMAAGIATAFATVVSGATEMVEFVRWAGQEAAVFMNGVAADDVVRLQREIERLEEMKNSSFLDRTILFGRDGLIEYYNDEELDAELGKLRGALDEALQGTLITPPSSSNAPVNTPVFSTGGGRGSSGASGSGKISAAEKEAKALIALYARAEESLNRQIALYGNASDAAALRYDLELGELRKLSGPQKAVLLSLQDELDARNSIKEIQNINLELLQATGQEQAARNLQFELEYAEKIAEYERQGNVEALQRLQTLKQIREINGKPEPGTVEGVTRAPGSDLGGLNTTGFGTDLERLDQQAQELEDWRQQELERQKAYLDAKEISEEAHAERVANIYEQNRERLQGIEQARQDVMYSAGESFFGDMADIAKAYAGEQSGIYRALFATSKAFAIADGLVQIGDGVAKAANNPWPVNLAAMASVAAAGAGVIANIQSVSAGFRQGGYTGSGGVDDVAGVVHGKEFVFDAGATARIGVQNLEAMRKGQPAANAPVMTHAAAAPSRGPMSITNNFTLQERTDNRTQQQIAIKAGQSQRQAQARLGG